MTERFAKDPTASGVQAAVFVVGLLLETYGLYFVLGPGSVLAGLAWMVGGILLQVAAGLRTASKEHGRRLVNPVAALNAELRRIRERVRRWDKH